MCRKDNNVKKSVKRFMLVLLCFCIVVGNLTAVRAEEKDYSENRGETLSIDHDKPDEIREYNIEFELTDKREEYVKHFHMKDGTNAAVTYESAVFYSDGTEIDNELKETEEGFSNYKNERFPIEFNKTPDEYLLSIDNILSIGYEGQNKETEGKLVEYIENKDSILRNKSISDIVRYEDVLPYTDIEYILYGKGCIKENIILKSKEASSEVIYRINEGFELREEKGYVVFSKDGEDRYYLQTPYAFDNKGEYTGELTLEVLDDTTIKLTLNEEWLKSAEYPVIIDPTITVQLNNSSVDNTSVYSSKPNSSQMYQFGAMWVGRESSAYGNCRGAFKFTLPTIDESDMVIGATVKLYMFDFRGSGNVYVLVSRITQNLPLNTLTWNLLNGKTGYSSDYAVTNINTKYNWFQFDVTTIVRDWYNNGNNYGLALVSRNEGGTYKYSRFMTTRFSQYPEYWPYATVTYLSKDGLEDYLTYESMSAFVLGTFNVGDFNGNLIYTYDDLAMTGNYLPVSVTHVYNHHQRTNAATVSSNMKFGKGFRLNVSQQIKYDSTNDWYTYTDEDGTVHYFLNDGGTYKEEFNDENILEINTNDYTIDWQTGKMVFYKNTGLLKQIEDKTNNKTQTYTYNSLNQLTTITDGAGRDVTFTYDSNKYLTKITYADNREVTYTYNSDGQLTGITQPNGVTTTFSYTSTGELERASNTDDGSIRVTYLSGTLKRVSSLRRYSSSNTAGEFLNFTYGYNETTVTDSTGYSNTYLFDKEGHTVCVRDSEGNAVYGAYENTDDNNKHSLSFESEMQSTSINLLKNHNPINTNNWTSTGTLTLVNTNDTNTFYNGKAFKITNGEKISQSVSVSVSAGDTYTISAYVKLLTGSSYGAYVGINDGTDHKCDLQGTIGQWQKISYTYTATSSLSSFTAILGGTGTGTAQFKNIKVEKGTVATRYSMVENSSFEQGTSNWTKGNTDSAYTVTTGRTGSGYKITGDPSAQRYLYQTITKSGHAGDKLILSGWAKSESVVPESMNTANNGNSLERHNDIRIVLLDSGNNVIEEHAVSFDSVSLNWQYVSAGITAGYDYSSIKIILGYEYQYKEITFDDIELFVESFGTTYIYDDDGREIQRKDSQGNIQDTAYKNISITTTDGTETLRVIDYVDYTRESDSSYHKRTTYSYDTKGNVTSEVYEDYNLPTSDPNRTQTITYHYDTNGNLEGTEINGQQTYESGEIGYDSNCISSYTDERGKTTTFSYDSTTGHLLSVTDAKNHTTTYTYVDHTDLVSSMTRSNNVVNFTYNTRGQLTSIEHNNGSDTSTRYVFTHDAFGNLTQINVGSNRKVRYTYEPNNGKLEQIIYQTNDTIRYEYDDLDRVTKIYKNDVLAYSFEYGTDGRLGKFTDHGTGETAGYEYDISGSPIREVRSDGTVLFNKYNDSHKLIQTGYKKGTNSSSASFTYDPKEDIESVTWNTNSSSALLTYQRDFLRRTTESTYTINNNDILVTDTNFLTITENNQTKVTSVMESVENTFGTNHFNYEYEYDNAGNINKITVTYNNQTYVYTYQYDSLNQLVRENDPLRNVTVKYAYDRGGGITSVKYYNYTTSDTLPDPIQTETYSYTTTGWRDWLNKFNGNTITYNTMGEPLTYYDGKVFTWSFRKLMGFTDNNNNTVAYTYDCDGIRTSKTVNNVTTQYLLSGSTILQETAPNKTIIYEYDEGGILRGMVYNGTRYVYVKNGTDDVIGILDSSGSLAARYDYDAFGQCTVTNYNGSTIGNINPFRYRSYYYDTESGFYYLNARYYDTNTRRFISTDEFEYLGAGDSIISYNLFVYCSNNPLNMADQDGTSACGVLGLGDYALIHKIVQLILCYQNGWLMEIFVRQAGTKRQGYLDIYDQNINAFYEVKSYKQANYTSTWRQINRYKGSIIQNTIGNYLKGLRKIHKTYPTLLTKNVKGQFQYGFYDISFGKYCNGLITYKYAYNWGRAVSYTTRALILTLIIMFPQCAAELFPLLSLQPA